MLEVMIFVFAGYGKFSAAVMVVRVPEVVMEL